MMNKQQQPTPNLKGASLGMALMDAVPVLCFCGIIALIATIFPSHFFRVGGILCIAAGTGKVLWKLLLAVSGKNVPVLTRHFKKGMIGGFLLICASLIIHRREISWGLIWKNMTWFPGNVLLIIGVAGILLMGVLAARMDQSSAGANWLEQGVNCVAQLSILMAVVLMWYGAGSLSAGETAGKACEGTDRVTVSQWENTLYFDGKGSDTAVVFYPGAKVAYTAYAPLLLRLAEAGVDGFAVEMPYNMAMFGINAMDQIMAAHPEYDHWYLAGHSLGGAMGSYYAADKYENMDGLILLGAYPAKDLKDTGLAILSVYGSEDGVLSMDKVEAGRSLVPESYTEYCIDGGNHAQMGDYGAQPGDSEANISPEAQWDTTAEQILSFIRE